VINATSRPAVRVPPNASQVREWRVEQVRVLVVGAGKVGFDISKRLSDEGHGVTVIDKEVEALREIQDNLDVLTVVGNGASARMLEQVNVENVDMVVAVTETDEVNMIACMTAKQCGVPMTVARIRNPEYAPDHPYALSYTRFGIDVIVNPEYLAAQEIFRLIEVPVATELEYFADGRVSVTGIRIEENADVVERKIRDLGISDSTVVAVSRGGRIVIPDGDTILRLNDKIFVLGRTTGFHHLNGIFSPRRTSLDRIIVAGGGLIAQYLLGLILSRRDAPRVMVIEPDPRRCNRLASEYARCEVICSDPTKIETLSGENIGPHDAYICVTGSDHSNLVSCMFARRLGVRQIISEVRREDYAPVWEDLGVNATVVPRLLTVSTVLKLVRRSKVVALTLLGSGEAEIVELVPEPGAPVTADRLRNLNFPKGAVVGSIIREGEVIVPRGDSEIEPGDHVIVFAELQAVSAVENLFRSPRAN